MGGMMKLNSINDLIAFLAIMMMFGAVTLMRYAARRIAAERRQRLPVRDLLH